MPTKGQIITKIAKVPWVHRKSKRRYGSLIIKVREVARTGKKFYCEDIRTNRKVAPLLFNMAKRGELLRFTTGSGNKSRTAFQVNPEYYAGKIV